jgi:Flp pilus assembly protein TadD
MIGKDVHQVVHLLAYQYLRQTQWERAEALFSWLLLASPADDSVRPALGYVLLERKRPFEALEALAPLATSQDPAVHFLRGRAFDSIGELALARTSFERFERLRAAERAESR